MHRIEIEEIADQRPPHPCRATPARVSSVAHFAHRSIRFALLQPEFGDRAPYRAKRARRAG